MAEQPENINASSTNCCSPIPFGEQWRTLHKTVKKVQKALGEHSDKTEAPTSAGDKASAAAQDRQGHVGKK